mgnify:CR=1 FL=1
MKTIFIYVRGGRTYMKKRKLRSINDTLRIIKEEDPDSAVTRYMINCLIIDKKIFSKKFGNQHFI